MTKVRLHNQGKRIIHIGPGQAIRPNDIAVVTPEVAKKHVRLYPKELVDLDNMGAQAEDGASGIKDFTKPASADDAAKDAEEEQSPAVAPAAAARRGGRRKAAAGDDALAEALKDE